MVRFATLALGALALAWFAGCSAGVPSVCRVRISPRDAATAAMAQYDKNKDGTLDAKELEASPGLQQLAKNLNKTQLTVDELMSRFDAYNRGDGGLQSVSTTVYFEGKPLAGATVTFVPEPFLGGSHKSASAITDAHGNANVQMEGQPFPGLFCGPYRVQITRPNDPPLPPRYNTATALGWEVGPPGGRIETDASFRLTSK